MAKPKVIEAGTYPKGLAEALEDLPHIEEIYVKGDEWHFVKRPGFTLIYREDVLGKPAGEDE